MGKINVGIIGCGRIADLHAPGYENNPAAGIFAICDTDRERAERRKHDWQAEKIYTDYREMLADPDVDVVEILSPQVLHEPMVIEAARNGKHIALQKPMTINLECADRMCEAVQKAGVIFRVTDNYLFYPPVVLARKMIDQGDIGTPTNIRIKMISGGSGGWNIPASAWEWRLEENAAGRGLQTFDHGHHLWATAWFLLGEIERVVSWIDTVDGIVDSPAVMMWKYKDGIKYGMCEYAYAAEMNIPSKYYANDEWIEVTGSRGIIVIHRCTGDIVEGPGVSLFNGNQWKYYSDIKTDWKEGFVGATDNFIRAVKGEVKPLLTGDEGREILRINLAISKSARVRREVYVAEMDAASPNRYTRRRIKREIKQTLPRKGLFGFLGLGAKDAGYAAQAKPLTEALLDRFNPETVEGWEADIGLQLLSEGGVPEIRFSLSIRDGKARLIEGRLPAEAALILKAPAGTWAAILMGKKRIETAFIQGKLKMEGKAEHGLKLRGAFGI